MPPCLMPSTLPFPSSTEEVRRIAYPRLPDDPSSSSDDSYTTEDSCSEIGGAPSEGGDVEEDFDEGDEDALQAPSEGGDIEEDFDEGDEDAPQVPSSGSTEYSDNEPAEECSSKSDEEDQQGSFSESQECSDAEQFEDVPIGMSDESIARLKGHGTRDDMAEDGVLPVVPEPKPMHQDAALLDLPQHAEEPLARQQLPGEILAGVENDIGDKYSLRIWELNSVNNYAVAVDWEGLHRDPNIRSKLRTARMLIHPKSSELHVVPHGERQDNETWIRVDGLPTAAHVLVVESGPKQFGCTLVYGYAFCHFTFDPDTDSIFLENFSRSRFDFAPLRGGQSQLSHSVEPDERVSIDKGIWTLAINGASVMEFEILRRRAFRIRGGTPSKRAAPNDERPTKRRKLLSKQDELVLAGGSTGKALGNPIFSMKEGQRLVCEEFDLKRHETIFENTRTLVWRGEYKVAEGSWEDCVVKTFKPGNEQRPQIIELWKRECDILQAVGPHVNIVTVLKADIRLNSLLLKPLVDAKALSDMINPNTTFSGTREDALRIIRDIAAALARVHARGFAHGDIKPSNILYGLERAVLIDFGVAFPFGRPLPSSGTPWYIPPEFRMMNWKLRGAPGDVWAFSLTAAWLIGYIQYPEKTWAAWKIAHLLQGANTEENKEARGKMNEWLEHVKKIRSILRITDPLENIIHRGLDPNRKTRISAAEICEELDRLCLTED
ncbi:kinase-like domain-containing protein [Nemania sp. FL0031]|nr:kinase-like domain-containing protein [Nemania sp. FL0031]